MQRSVEAEIFQTAPKPEGQIVKLQNHHQNPDQNPSAWARCDRRRVYFHTHWCNSAVYCPDLSNRYPSLLNQLVASLQLWLQNHYVIQYHAD